MEAKIEDLKVVVDLSVWETRIEQTEKAKQASMNLAQQEAIAPAVMCTCSEDAEAAIRDKAVMFPNHRFGIFGLEEILRLDVALKIEGPKKKKAKPRKKTLKK